MVNLISNAIKYTDAGVARLTVAHHALPDGRHELSLAVSDTGPGMSGDEMRQAFDIYGRTVHARRSGLPGVGLGLAIVLVIYRCHGRRIAGQHRAGGRAAASRRR